MNRPTVPSDTPNFYSDRQPLPPTNQSPSEDGSPEPETFFSRCEPASFPDSQISWHQGKSKARLKLSRSIAILKSVEIPGRVHAIGYLEHLYRRNCKARTIQNARICIYFFLLFIKQLGRQYLDQIVRKDVEAFVEHEQDRGLKPKSVLLRIQTLYAFFKFLEPDNVIHPDVLKRKIRIKIPQSLPKAMACGDVAKMFSVIKNKRDHALVLILLRTGMRIGELLNLTIHDVDLEGRTIRIYQGEKNRVGRVVYLSNDALRGLLEWLTLRNDRELYLFYGSLGKLSYSSIRRRFMNYMEKAGLPHKGYTLHCLRHTFATDLLNVGMRLECLQQLLGHSKIEVTRIYARLSDQTREEEYFRAMNKIERGGQDEHYGCDHQLPAVFEA
ncbi:MAG: tyrosine-type recombinase/integrase [Pseudomonadota bacterium]